MLVHYGDSASTLRAGQVRDFAPQLRVASLVSRMIEHTGLPVVEDNTLVNRLGLGSLLETCVLFGIATSHMRKQFECHAPFQRASKARGSRAGIFRAPNSVARCSARRL